VRGASWHRDQDSVVGQLAEWEVWVELVVQSQGRLHVFLPLLDRGVDALIHRLDDGRWIPVQVKGRSQLRNGSLYIVMRDSSLVDPDALIVGVALEDDHIGPFVLVISERKFARLAIRSTARGKPVVAAQVSFVVGRPSRWSRFVFPKGDLAVALMAGIKPKFKVSPPPRVRGAIARATGFRGEAEVMRRLADVDELTIYRAFPDLETAEIVVLHEKSRRVLGIQVKTIGVDRKHPNGTIDIDLASFRPSATTWVAAVAWDRDAISFRDECLVIPSLELAQIVPPYRGHLRFPYYPDSPLKWGRLTPYRRPLAELGRLIAANLINPVP
jgi:hypothetical protein